MSKRKLAVSSQTPAATNCPLRVAPLAFSDDSISPQRTNHDSSEHLYNLIRKRVKRTKFTRQLVNPDEVANEVFLRLSDQELPAFGSEEFENLLRRTTGHVIRDFKQFSKNLTDIDEITEDEHPFYEMNFFSEAEDFEYVFSKFCESVPEPKRTVFGKSRILTKENIAEITGLSRRKVAQIIQLMPNHFEKFYENFSSESTAVKKIAH